MAEEAKKFKEVEFNGQKMHLKGYFYDVADMFGESKRLICLELETKDGEGYLTLTKSFGEFVGKYGTLFLDINNIPGVEDFVKNEKIAFPIGATKTSGFVTYPAYRLSPYLMEELFTEEEILEYKFDYDFYGDMEEDLERIIEETMLAAESEGNPISEEEAAKKAGRELVLDSIAREKKSFDQYIKSLEEDGMEIDN